MSTLVGEEERCLMPSDADDAAMMRERDGDDEASACYATRR